MALILDQQPNFKHFCRICKKGFFCGRALGGHMRAHGIGDEGVSFDDDDQASDWEDKSRGGGGGGDESMQHTNYKHAYGLRTNPNRQRSSKLCKNCGKEFSSWKSFLEHGKCSSDDAESLVSSAGSDGEEDDDSRPRVWSKRKRSFRTNVGSFTPNNCASTEEEGLAANCLMMLSNAMVDPTLADQPEESSASASKDEERRNLIAFMAPIVTPTPSYFEHKGKGVATSTPKGMFECKACKKVFSSHQALGGHRASHKKVKGCFAARLDHVDQDSIGDEDHMLASDPDFMRPSKSICTTMQLENGRSNSPLQMSKKKSKVHECSICHRVFSSGQALGGHKRCHWITSNAPDPSTLARFQELQDQIEQSVQEMPNFNHGDKALDLNIPVQNDNTLTIRRDPRNTLSFEVSTDIFLKPWGGASVDIKCRDEINENINRDDNIIPLEKKTNKNIIHNNGSGVTYNTNDEADSKVKLAKLCEIKDDMGSNGNSSPWLQVGIASTSAVGADS